ncbi:uncharacterized protein LOC128295227 [Gossypium arboreum]|uniref:Thionin-like protein 2 n=1 Tax=Gossypium arboreum TaxID=29729 RepID=A0ABR0PGP4_GOSAR|nr:uncharacterized protein LOC128295227 [Gossypium arboreum]KAK5820389.1 hypothetical protein PVK06_025436 [Gossypium arboreum]
MVAKKMMAINLMVLMMMAMVVNEVRASENLDVERGVKEGIGSCAKECALKCLPQINPRRIVICTALCIIACKLNPPPAIFNCTTDCSTSIIKTDDPTEARKIDSIVGSCYETCKNNN